MPSFASEDIEFCHKQQPAPAIDLTRLYKSWLALGHSATWTDGLQLEKVGIWFGVEQGSWASIVQVVSKVRVPYVNQ